MSKTETARDLYTRCYQNENYRMGAPRFDRVLQEINRVDETYGFGSLLDVGCGRGELVAGVQRRFPVVVGCEIVPDLCDGINVHLIDTVAELPYGNGSFDAVVCSDVLEHIPVQDSIVAMRELYRVARMCVICHVAWFTHVWEGTELHVNRRRLTLDSKQPPDTKLPAGDMTWLDIAERCVAPGEKVTTEGDGLLGLLTIHK